MKEDIVDQAIEALSDERERYLLKSFKWDGRTLNIDQLQNELENMNKYIHYNLGDNYHAVVRNRYQDVYFIVQKKFLFWWINYHEDLEMFFFFGSDQKNKFLTTPGLFEEFVSYLSRRIICGSG